MTRASARPRWGDEDDAARPSWGDDDDEEESRSTKQDTFLPQTVVSEPDQFGIKTIVEYRMRDDGKKLRITRKVRVKKEVVRVPRAAEQRKKWKKFGECANLPPGPEKGVTLIGDDVSVTAVKKPKVVGKAAAGGAKSGSDATSLGIVCRHCKRAGDHWSTNCPFKDKIAAMTPLTSPMPTGDDDNDYDRPRIQPGKDAYLPPNARPGARDEAATVRVTNLSEDTKESDLHELFHPFGPISRIYLAKDKDTNLSRGFAFVSFVNRNDAQASIDQLSGYGYDHLILHLEWAKPSAGK